MGKGKEYFGYANNPLQINAPPVCLPYTVLDRLIMELEANSKDSTYKTVSQIFSCCLVRTLTQKLFGTCLTVIK